MEKKIMVTKKNGIIVPFDGNKIVSAIRLSANRAMAPLTESNEEKVISLVLGMIKGEKTSVQELHIMVELALDQVNPKVAKAYRDYRNYKVDAARMLDEVMEDADNITFGEDRNNANSDSSLVSTKRALILGALEKRRYLKTFLSPEQRKAEEEGYFYIHDKNARLLTMNCCLFDMQKVLEGGFSMGNLSYTEPNSLDTAFDVIGDVILSAAGQQYGGFTIPEIDKTLAYYAEKSYIKYKNEFQLQVNEMYQAFFDDRDNQESLQQDWRKIQKDAWIQTKEHEYAMKKLYHDFCQGWQGLEYKLNSVGSSRGDYPFVTVTFGLGVDRFEKMASITALRVHAEGQGREGHKVPTLFPKYVFLYDKNLHGPGCVNNDVFEEGIKCSSKTMYPDWLSLTGEGYVPDIYKKYGRVISPMGCRAFLSPWYEKGGLYPADEDDKPVFVGRFNLGAISLHLPMIYAKAQAECKDFHDVLDHYLEMIRCIHKNTISYLGKMRASTNPLAYCEGGFLNGHLKPNDQIAPLLKSATVSFGITALNELQELYNGKSIAEDGVFALETLKYINKKVAQFKEEDGILYAIYGTPAETLCSLQVEQFRKKYGIKAGVSDKPYVSNSFHCHVTERLSPIQKQDLERRFWDYCNGGKIQYVRYPLGYNKEAVRTLILRAMDLGFYEGVNLDLCYCMDCGHEQVDMDDTCPVCGSENLIKIDRMNGYLGYTRLGVKANSRYHDGKLAEIRDRVSM